MQRLIFQNSKGEELELTSGNYGVVNWAGLSDVPLNIQTQTVPMVDGLVYLDSVLGQRDISVTVAINDNNSLARRYELKRELISALNPKNGEGYVIYHNDYLSRRIKAVANMPIFENKNANDSGSLKAEEVFTCCDPYWEDLAESAVNMESFTEYTVKNEGDVPCQIKMEVANWNTPNFAVRNGRQKIALKNINDCDKIFINTNMGEKSVIKETEEWKIGNANETFYNVAYSEELNIYVTVGGHGIILYSKDGKNWIPSMSTYVTSYLNNIVWVKEKSFFICNTHASGSGHFYISYNGIDWEEYITESFTNNEYINCICFSPKLNLFVAVGGYTTPSRLILTSSDGMNWTIQETTNASALNTVIWSEELEIFVAVGNSGAILTSPDGITWTSRTSGTSVNLQGIAWAKDLSFFIAGGLNLTLKSNNGTNWSQIGTETISANLIYSEDLNTFITGSLKKSSDGIIWESATVPINVLDCIYSPVLGQFIAVGDKGCIAISDDFYTWQKILWNKIVSNNTARSLRSCVYNKDTGLYYAVGEASVIYSSPDGKNWTSLYSGNPSNNLYSICYSEKLHLLIAASNNSNIILKSSDGTNWTGQQIQGLASGNCVLWVDSLEMFIIVGNNKIIFTSPDGVTWTIRTSGGSALMGVTYSEKLGLFAAVGAQGVILTSPDAVTWTSQTSGVSTYLNSVAWSEESELFAAVGDNGVILTSLDGVTWTSQISNITYNLYSIVYSAERKSFWVVGRYGYILKSETGYNWSVTAQGGSLYFYGLCYSTTKQQFLVVGYQGSVFYNQIIPNINIIDRLTADSDMSFNLEPGDNKVQIYNVPRNITARLTYRQKYIGV